MLKEHWDEMTRAGRDWSVVTVLTLAPLALGVMAMFLFSRTDAQTFAALVANLNVVSIFTTGLALGFLPVVILGVTFWWAHSCYTRADLIVRNSKKGRTIYGLGNGRRCVVAAAIFATALTQSAPTARLSILLVGSILIRTFVRDSEIKKNFLAAHHKRAYVRRVTRECVASKTQNILGLLGTLFIALASNLTMGFPAEVVQIEQEYPPSLGYVVVVDDVSLTLAYVDGGIRRIPTGLIVARAVCPRGSRVLRGHSGDLSVIQELVKAAGDKPYVPLECGTDRVRTS
jgi:hypothetical protein